MYGDAIVPRRKVFQTKTPVYWWSEKVRRLGKSFVTKSVKARKSASKDSARKHWSLSWRKSKDTRKSGPRNFFKISFWLFFRNTQWTRLEPQYAAEMHPVTVDEIREFDILWEKIGRLGRIKFPTSRLRQHWMKTRTCLLTVSSHVWKMLRFFSVKSQN